MTLMPDRPRVSYLPCAKCGLVMRRGPQQDAVVNGHIDRSVNPAVGYVVCDNGHRFDNWKAEKAGTGFCLDCGNWVVLEWPSSACPKGHAASSVLDVRDSTYAERLWSR